MTAFEWSREKTVDMASHGFARELAARRFEPRGPEKPPDKIMAFRQNGVDFVRVSPHTGG